MNRQTGSSSKPQLISAPIAPIGSDDSWEVHSYLGDGIYAEVVSIRHLTTNKLLAVKIENKSEESSYNECISGTLEREYHTYRYIHEKLCNIDSIAIPCVHSLIEDGSSPAMMTMDLLGASLKNVFDRCGGGFSLKTVLQIGDQVLKTLSQLHSIGICHGDIHWGNVLIGQNENGKTFYLVDFGNAVNLSISKPKSTVPGMQLFEDDGDQSEEDSCDDPNRLSINQRIRKTDLDRLVRMLDWLLADEEHEDCRSARKFRKFCSQFTRLEPTPKALDIDYLRGMFHQWFEHEGFVRDGNFEWGETL